MERNKISQLHEQKNTGARRCQIMSLLSILAIVLLYNDAKGQLQVIQPVFKRIYGATAWGSVGVRRNESRSVRGGFAVLYAALGKKDTVEVVTFESAIVEVDSVILENNTYDSKKVPRKYSRLKKTIKYASESETYKNGPSMSIAFGYESSYTYRFDDKGIRSQIPVEGIYIAAFQRFLQVRRGPLGSLSVGVSAGIFSLSDIPGSVGDSRVSFSSKRVIAPEFYFVISTPAQIYFDVSWQYLKFSGIRYSRLYGTLEPADVTLRNLPTEIDLSRFHFTCGLRFSTRGLF